MHLLVIDPSYPILLMYQIMSRLVYICIYLYIPMALIMCSLNSLSLSLPLPADMRAYERSRECSARRPLLVTHGQGTARTYATALCNSALQFGVILIYVQALISAPLKTALPLSLHSNRIESPLFNYESVGSTSFCCLQSTFLALIVHFSGFIYEDGVQRVQWGRGDHRRQKISAGCRYILDARLMSD